jgi:hypothetical protein
MSLILAILLVLIALAIAAYDMYAAFGPGPEYTVSALIGEWSGRVPIIPFLLGLVAGHLFWPRGGPLPPAQL